MDLDDKALKRSTTPNVGFFDESVLAEGKITLPVTITNTQGVTITVPQKFNIINAPIRYNCILGRKFTVLITGIPSTHHQTLLFVGKDGRVERARGNQKMARSFNFVNKVSVEPQRKREGAEADMVLLKSFESNQSNKKLKSVASPSGPGTQKIVEIDPRPSEDENVKISTPQMEIDHQMIKEVALIEGTDKTVRIGGNLDPQVCLHLIQVLHENVDLFAYSAANMPSIDPEIVTHKINVHEESSLLNKRKGTSALKKTKSLKKKFKSCWMMVSLRNVSTRNGWLMLFW